eukprot:9325667-Ditylum_brightwellii.AAC.1
MQNKNKNNNENNNNIYDNDTVILSTPLVPSHDEDEIWELATVIQFETEEDFWIWYWTVFFLYDYVWAAPQA